MALKDLKIFFEQIKAKAEEYYEEKVSTTFNDVILEVVHHAHPNYNCTELLMVENKQDANNDICFDENIVATKKLGTSVEEFLDEETLEFFKGRIKVSADMDS